MDIMGMLVKALPPQLIGSVTNLAAQFEAMQQQLDRIETQNKEILACLSTAKAKEQAAA
jgi:chaperonin cofactor prefoldin